MYQAPLDAGLSRTQTSSSPSSSSSCPEGLTGAPESAFKRLLLRDDLLSLLRFGFATIGSGWVVLVSSRDCLDDCDGPLAAFALFVLPFLVAVCFEPLPDPRLWLLAVPLPDGT